MLFQIEYQILPSDIIRDYIFKVNTKKEAEEELLKKYTNQKIKILKIKKV